MMRLSVSMNPREMRLGWLLMALQLLVLPLVLVAANDLLQLRLTDAELNFTMFCMNFALTWFVFHRYLWQSLQVFVRDIWRSLRFAVWGFGIQYVATLLLGMLIAHVFPDFSNVNNDHILSMADEQFTLMALGVVLLVPVTEETLYRGLIFRGLHRKSRLLAYAVSMTVFSAIHIVGYLGSASWQTLAIAFVQYLPAGFALAWAYERTDSVWTGILIHMTVNQLAFR